VNKKLFTDPPDASPPGDFLEIDSPKIANTSQSANSYGSPTEEVPPPAPASDCPEIEISDPMESPQNQEEDCSSIKDLAIPISIKKGTPETPYNVFYEIEVTEYKISQKVQPKDEKIPDQCPSIENISINGSDMVEMPSETLDFNDATETEPEAESYLENFAENLHFTPPDSPAQESPPEIYNEQMVELILTSRDTSQQKISQIIPYILKSSASDNLSSSDFDAEDESSPTLSQKAIPPAQTQLSRVTLIKNLSACSFQNIQIMDASCDYLGLGFGDLSGVDKVGLSSQEDTKIESDHNIFGPEGKKTWNTSFGCSSAETLDVFVVGGMGCKVDQHIKNIFGINKKQSYELLSARADGGNGRRVGDSQNLDVSEAE
jgi:hypothetical protein